MNILMQLRKVCNHPNLFEARPITSPFQQVASDAIVYSLPRLVADACQPSLLAVGGGLPDWLDRAGSAARLLGQTQNLAEMARDLPNFVARRVFELRARPGLITVVDSTTTVDPGNHWVLSFRISVRAC